MTNKSSLNQRILDQENLLNTKENPTEDDYRVLRELKLEQHQRDISYEK